MSPNGQEMSHSKTSVRRGQPNPLYKETFMFQVAETQLPEVTLMVSVFYNRNIKRKEMIGWFSLGTERNRSFRGMGNTCERSSHCWKAAAGTHGDGVPTVKERIMDGIANHFPLDCRILHIQSQIFFWGLYPPHLRRNAAGAWTQTPFSAWIACVPIVLVLRNDHCWTPSLLQKLQYNRAPAANSVVWTSNKHLYTVSRKIAPFFFYKSFA